jgi:hypothetical protein
MHDEDAQKGLHPFDVATEPGDDDEKATDHLKE